MKGLSRRKGCLVFFVIAAALLIAAANWVLTTQEIGSDICYRLAPTGSAFRVISTTTYTPINPRYMARDRLEMGSTSDANRQIIAEVWPSGFDARADCSGITFFDESKWVFILTQEKVWITDDAGASFFSAHEAIEEVGRSQNMRVWAIEDIAFDTRYDGVENIAVAEYDEYGFRISDPVTWELATHDGGHTWSLLTTSLPD